MRRGLLALIMVIGASSQVVLADGFFPGWNHGGGDYGYGGQVSCRAGDAGWEEHWGGHSSCGECLKKHGRCIETCTQTYYSCRAVGVEGYGDYERTIEFEALAPNRWRAQDKALERCWRSGASSCSVRDCNSQSETVSRKNC